VINCARSSYTSILIGFGRDRIVNGIGTDNDNRALRIHLFCWGDGTMNRTASLGLGLLGGLAPLMVMGSEVGSATMPTNVIFPEPVLVATEPDDLSPTEREVLSSYSEVIRQTVDMVRDPEAQELAAQFGLNILDVTWEDTGRYYNSAVGPNISDMTIQVQHRDPDTGDYRLSLMPVIRHPNFEDLTADIPLDQFYVLVGNERGEDLQRVSLRTLLDNLRDYLHEPESWAGEETSLLADRDSHVLVSAQACFLPVPRGDMAEFNPVLFNYQSYPGNPAVLTILATREGTSVTVIDNARDGFQAGPTWGQRLFFNQNGERASFTGQRISDFLAEGTDRPNGGEAPDAAGESGLNMVLLIQVPLLQPENTDRSQMPVAPSGTTMFSLSEEAALSDVEEAVIGHGEVEGPFTEIDNLPIERDPRFPIRVTVQFYKATSNGVVSEADMTEINDQIARVYDDADYVGSLVVDGPSRRPTEYDGPHTEPDDWWQEFWQNLEARTGQSREDVLELWRWLRGGERSEEGDRPQ
jgi:hypothetical protein